MTLLGADTSCGWAQRTACCQPSTRAKEAFGSEVAVTILEDLRRRQAPLLLRAVKESREVGGPNGRSYSMTSSATASCASGIRTPSARAVLRLMTSSNFV